MLFEKHYSFQERWTAQMTDIDQHRAQLSFCYFQITELNISWLPDHHRTAVVSTQLGENHCLELYCRSIDPTKIENGSPVQKVGNKVGEALD